MKCLAEQAARWFKAFGSWNGVSTEGAFTQGYIKGWVEAQKAYAKNINLLLNKPPQDLQ